MAEIRVEPRRRSLMWLWVLLAVLVIGALVAYYLMAGTGDTVQTAPTTGALDAPIGVVAAHVRAAVHAIAVAA